MFSNIFTRPYYEVSTALIFSSYQMEQIPTICPPCHSSLTSHTTLKQRVILTKTCYKYELPPSSSQTIFPILAYTFVILPVP